MFVRGCGWYLFFFINSDNINIGFYYVCVYIYEVVKVEFICIGVFVCFKIIINMWNS